MRVTTKRQERMQKAARNSDSSSRPKFHYRSYCPECPMMEIADPERHTHVQVTQDQKTATCRFGHRWTVRH